MTNVEGSDAQTLKVRVKWPKQSAISKLCALLRTFALFPSLRDFPVIKRQELVCDVR